MDNYRPDIEEFSDGYYIFADARVVPYNSDYAAIAPDVYAFLEARLHDPLFKVDNSYFYPRAESNVPPDVVAVPKSVASEPDENTVFIAKPETRDKLINDGVA